MCKVCEEVMKNGEYVVDGAWTRLKIEKHKDKFHILAIGEGMADMEIKYCPFCGKKLGNDEVEIIGHDTNVATKIEELRIDVFNCEALDCENEILRIKDKLNEVIRELNRRSE